MSGTTQAARIAALEAALADAMAKINELVASAKPLADEVVRAHARIDHAGDVFKDLRQALKPKVEPQRVPRAEFDRALEDLRADAEEAGSSQRVFHRDVILQRAARLRELALVG